jgi:hypothetical protein
MSLLIGVINLFISTFNDKLYNNFERKASIGTHYVLALFATNLLI